MQRFTIFGRPDCGYCVRAKRVLDQCGYPYRWVDIHQEGISKGDLAATIGRPVATVPQIFHGESHIGGFTELDQYLKTLSAA